MFRMDIDMNVYHFEYEHDMKLVGELLVSTLFMGLSYLFSSLCISLFFISSRKGIKASVYQYVFLYVVPYIWVYLYVFLYVVPYIWVYLYVFSLFVFSYFHPSF